MRINTQRRAVVLCATLLGTSLATHADENDASQGERELIETMTVIAPLRSPGQVTLFTGDVASGRETGDLLRDMLGVSGSRMGGHGIDPVIRGLGMTRINVLLDGAFVHGACPNRMDPPTAYGPTGGYSQITVIRGVNTLEYGGGPGGSVLLERRTERFAVGEGLRTSLQGGWRGNSDTRELAADLAAGGPSGYIRVLASQMDADDYEDGRGNPVRSAFEERSATVIAGWTPDEHTRLELSAEAQRLRDELFAGAGMDSPSSDNDVLRLRFETGRVGPLTSLNAQLAVSRVEHVMDNYSLRTPPSPMMLMRAPSQSDTDSGRVVGEIEQSAATWRFGFTFQNNARDAIRVNDANGMLNSVLWPGVELNQSGMFVERQTALRHDRRLTSGLRYDHVTARATRTEEQPGGNFLSPGALYALYYGDADGTRRTENHWSALLRYEQDLSRAPGLWYVGFSRSLRTADATERYMASNAAMPSMRWVGNPTLSPERHHQLETGLFISQPRWDFDASVFVNDIDGYILRDRFREPGNNATIYRNIDARLWGGEIAVGRELAEGWRGEIGLGYVRADNRSDRRPIAQTPPLEARASVQFRSQQWLAGLGLRAAARQTRVDDNPWVGSGLDTGPTPGWLSVNLNARYRLSEQLRLDAGIDNLFDRFYAEHLNRASTFDVDQVQVNEPGRSLWLRLGMEF